VSCGRRPALDDAKLSVGQRPEAELAGVERDMRGAWAEQWPVSRGKYTAWHCDETVELDVLSGGDLDDTGLRHIEADE